ncbi:hypothetical protein [Mycobacteroides abscessus]|uniref:hypothetical protein n=1 Tax=Mycobacteroides abscessus TaxID=36809 RepID=UPI0009280D91|nr:hypothetical protein [Mycobacteroides abscessus]SHP99060.1 Uncharacterised protein [Mycobacteroides abscessus subsp. abscessus]SHQ61641.1 Uncharacterised protein [Mycobacteroides abscessus subsp. abscessus]SKD62859.1 Uncharacterised protein [Mycobacteroides abscessus subsp. abscessus]SLD63286.1 Uncharacterised protein [Mycobacteroides abscessus subsp. abscessus]
MTGDPLDSLLATIDQLDDDEPDDFPWTDAARWSPAALVELANDPYDVLPELDDGAVIVTDPERPWVVTVYEPPWWAAE